MDKRTIVFVLAVSFALFLVNMYFDQQRQESLKEWSKQQEAKQEKKQQELTQQVAAKTAKIEDIPSVKIFADESESQFLSTGIVSENAVVTIKNKAPLPQTVYIDKKPYLLTFEQPGDSGVVIYSVDGKTPLTIAELPDFGHYDLQLVTSGQSPQIYLGDYTDGHFNIPAEQIAALKRPPLEEKPLPPLFHENGLIVIKVKDKYLPTAAYLTTQHRVEYLDEIQNAKVTPTTVLAAAPISKEGKQLEKYYVLQNSFQQLVFSNYGGALAEINLPYLSKEDRESVVREIEFDRDMVKQNPQNARFPLHPYFTPGKSATEPAIAHTEGQLGGYYPLIRRDLIETGNRKSVHIPPKLYALNIVSEYPEVAELVYDVKEFTETKIVFEAVQSHRKITKTFEIVEPPTGGPYCLYLTINIDGDSRGLWLTSGIPEVELISGSPAPVLKYRITRQGSPQVISLDLPTDATTISSTKPDWIANSNGFLGIVMDPLAQDTSGLRAQYVSGVTAPSRLTMIDRQFERFPTDTLPGYNMTMPLNPAGGQMKFRMFCGPFASSILKEVDAIYSDAATGYNPDYVANITFHGWFSFISEPFAKFMFVIMNFFYSLTGSWGISIILLTIFLRLLLYPLNAWTFKSSAKMQQIAPEVAAIQEKYKKDPKKAQMEVVNLYREKGINPLSGCFPLLIQMPFLIGMFDLLKSTFELRGASFIPGWIDNLTAPDVLFSWSYPIFFIGNQFHLLPVLLGLVMFVQQKLMSPMPKDQSQWTDQQRQQRVMGNMMTFVFTFMFYNFPSGLNIYWLSSMVLGILQQLWTTKRQKTSASPTTPTPVKPQGGKPKKV